MTTRPAPRGRPPGRRGRPRYFTRRKVCSFCVNHVEYIDYKDVGAFRRYLSPRFMIESRRRTGVCSKHQRSLAVAIKRAQHLAMMPFSRAHKGRGLQFAD